MSGGQIFPISTSPEPDVTVTSDGLPTDWLQATSVSFADQYMTPFPTTSLENQQWTSFAKPLMPEGTVAPPVLGTSFPSYYMANALGRPRSSPSTFGAPDLVQWPLSSGLGIQYPLQLEAIPPPLQTDIFDHEPDHYSSRDTPELQAPTPRRPYQTIAPNPVGLASKRRREEEEGDSDGGSGKRRRRTGSVNSTDLSEDDRYLVRLKENESLPWKEIATRFQTDKGKNFQVPALQMRYKRLREKFRMWEEQDVNALKLAHDYWTKHKWEIISQKMSEFGSTERWPARSCARKWQEMELVTAVTLATCTAGITPAMTHMTSNPTDAPIHFAFLPMQ